MAGKSKSKPKNASEKAPDTQAPTASRAGRKKNKEAADIIDIDLDHDSGEKERANSIPWADNPAWISKAVDHLASTPEFRIKLFSDSTEDASTEGRKKLQGKESKINMFSKLAEVIFTDEATASEDIRTAYTQDKGRYAKSLQQQFARCVNYPNLVCCTNIAVRLKKQYSKLIKGLYQTGGGLKPEDQQSNLIGMWF